MIRAMNFSAAARGRIWRRTIPILLRFCLPIFLAGCSAKHPAVAPIRSFGGPAFVFPPHSAVTVQSHPTDTALSCPDLQGLPVHSDNQGAFANLFSSANPAESFIVGHGEPGKLCTGANGACNTTASSLNSDDVDDWRRYAHSLSGRFPRLTLLGCSVGVGKGAILVARLAQETQMTVAAPRGLVWCVSGSLLVDSSTEWVEAKPGEQPKPVPPPPYTVLPESQFLLSLRGEIQPISASSVHVDLFQYSDSALRLSPDPSQDVATLLATRIDFANPFKKNGTLLAVTTGRIQLSVTLPGDAIVVKHYALYADAVVGDLDDPVVFYHVDSRLHAELETLRGE